MKLPRVTISGARGIVGEDLTVESALCLTRAFARLMERGPVVVGRDARASGPMIEAAVEAGLMAEGREVIRVGLAPTPTVGIMVRERDAAGAINITASHNPPQWNALKFYNKQGVFLTPDQVIQLVQSIKEQPGNAPPGDWGTCQDDSSALETHCRQVLEHVDSFSIMSRAYCVAVDGCRSVGGIFLPRLLRELGCEVIEVDCQPDGRFTRPLEPTPTALSALCDRVVARKCVAGFAVDPDADRLSLVDEHGVAIGEEYSVALTVAHVLGRSGGGSAVVNLSTSMMVDAAARAAGGRVIRTPIGEAHVVDAMLRENAEIGGEGNGGVIYPRVHPGRDSLSGAALILEAMVLSGQPLSALVAQLPKTTMLKEKISLSSFPSIDWVSHAANEISEATVNTTDGLKVIYEDGWYHVRLSNTEPACRIIAEATTEERADKLMTAARKTAETLSAAG